MRFAKFVKESETESHLDELVERFFAAPSPDLRTGSDHPCLARTRILRTGAHVEIRRAAFVPEIRAVSEEDRTITFTSSTESVDRYGDILRVKGWKLDAYKKNPVFLWGHRSDQPPIGRTINVHTEWNPPALVQKVEFADKETYPFADTIFNLYKGGFLKSVSVGFRPLEDPTPIRNDEGGMTGYEYTSQELLELSAVPVPANTDAVARAVATGILMEADVAKFFSAGVTQALTPEAKLADALDRFEFSLWKAERALARLEKQRSQSSVTTVISQEADPLAELFAALGGEQ